DEVALIEFGPGRGTMMKDALRAARAAPGFRKAVRGHLIETSPDLQSQQRRTLSGVDVALRWHASIDEVPAVPSIVVANEFFDALPIRQGERRPKGWHERTAAGDAKGALTLTVARDPLPDLEPQLPEAVAHARVGAIFEWRPQQYAIASEISRRA